MSDNFWPSYDFESSSSEIPTIGYLDWYVPRLKEIRPHNLSFSGMQYDWDIKEIMGPSINHVANHHITDLADPRINVANREGVNVENVVICHGATQALNIALCAAMVGRENNRLSVAVESPAYAPIPQAPQLFNCSINKITRNPPESGFGPWRINREEWLEAINKSSILMLTPILNPSGWDYHEDDRKWIVETCKNYNVIIIADEVYLDSKRINDEYIPFHSLGDHCISINSLTKVYSLGTLRFGWLIASPKISEQARRAFLTLSGMMGSPTLRIADAVFPSLEKVLFKLEYYRNENLPLVRDMLDRLNIEWNEPKYGVFGAIKLPHEINSSEFVDGPCKEFGVLAVPGIMFDPKLVSWLRIAWSIEPKPFREAINNLEKALVLAISQKTSQ